MATLANPEGQVRSGKLDRRQQLIEATITAVAEYGLSNTTVAKVAQLAGLSPGIVSFYFTGKDALLLATLRHLAEEFEDATRHALARGRTNPMDAISALVDASFDPAISDPRKVAVWYAFWGEARARSDYLKLCGDRDAAYHETIFELCRSIIAAGDAALGKAPAIDAEAVTKGLTGLLDELWQDILVTPEHYDREAAKKTCRAYLASVFPWAFAMPDRPSRANGSDAATATLDGSMPLELTREAALPNESESAPLSLPAWTYDNAAFFAFERERILRPAWQIICHVNEITNPGAYVAMELLGERVFVIRGDDGALRAFHNVCRHRAHAVVAGQAGACAGVIRCPYHGWTYGLDGQLKAIAAAKTFPGVDKSRLGLKPIDLEVFLGFVFIRLESRGPSVAERFAPYLEELSHYRLEEVRPCERLWLHETGADWKNVWDNYLEGYHFPTAHPGLNALMDSRYDCQTDSRQVARLSHTMRAQPLRSWSAKLYRKLLPAYEHLPEALRTRWSYFFLYPAIAFDIFPDKMDYFQVLPTGPGQSVLRGRSYVLPDDRRETRAARYLNLRLNKQVQCEDNSLVRSVQGGLRSSGYTAGPLSEKELVVRRFQDWIRHAVPEARLTAPPPSGAPARPI